VRSSGADLRVADVATLLAETALNSLDDNGPA